MDTLSDVAQSNMLTLIAAIAQNGCIGKDGKLPWRLPDDMAHFRELTTGHVVLMGRKTWESLPQQFRPLPGRTNVVVTNQQEYVVPPGVSIFHDTKTALTHFTSEDIYVIGGAMLYAQTIAFADRLEITHVDRTVDGDAFFPAIDHAQWHAVAEEQHDGFRFVTYERVKLHA
ncbi:MAG: dihydrofolate reductase [bacterium]|nr:dihydrofolate reductase [bacterium]